jgi:hypothetical protein
MGAKISRRSSPQVVDTHSWRHLIKQIGVTGVGTHVTSQLHHEAVSFDGDRAMSSPGSLGFGSLLEIFEVSPQQLLKVGWRLSFPGHSKDSTAGRCKFADKHSGGSAQFVDRICGRLRAAQTRVHMDLIGLYGGNVTT